MGTGTEGLPQYYLPDIPLRKSIRALPFRKAEARTGHPACRPDRREPGLAIAAGDMAGAAGARSRQSVGSVEVRAAGEPVMAIVSLRRQQITIYDAEGWILRAPVSTGQSGRETPAGVFSVIRKKPSTTPTYTTTPTCPICSASPGRGSPFMVELLPTHPASHGCIRLPYEFAERLFDMTKLGHACDCGARRRCAGLDRAPGFVPTEGGCRRCRSRSSRRSRGGDEKADEAGLVVFKVSREAAQAMVPVRVAENLKLRAEARRGFRARARVGIIGRGQGAGGRRQSESGSVSYRTFGTPGDRQSRTATQT